MIRAAAGAAFLLATAAAGAPDGPFARIPTQFKVYLNETAVLEIPPSMGFILSDYSRIEAVRVKEGVQLRGKFLGGAELILSNGEETESVTVTVVVPPSRQFDASGRALFAAPKDELGILTGGWLSQGSLNATTSGTSERGFSSRALSASLAGANDAISYSLYGSNLKVGDATTATDVRAAASGKWGLASFDSAAERSEFRPVPFGLPYRQGFLRLNSDEYAVEGGVRAPYRYDRLAFSPEAVRGFAEGKFGPAFAGAGVIGGGLAGGQEEWLPFAATGVRSGPLGVSLFGGAVAGAAAHVVGAEAHGALGPCALSAQFTSGLRGPDADAARLALQAYVDPNQDAFSSRGQCRVGKMLLSLGASRGGTPSPLIDPSAVLLTGSASYATPGATLFATGQWSARGQDLRNFASLFGQMTAGKFVLSTALNASRPLLDWNFNETVMVRRLFGATSVGLSGGTSHSTGLPQAGWTAIDGQIRNEWLLASASVSANFSTFSRTTWNGAAQVEWFPYRAYAVRAYSAVDLEHYRNWNVSLGISYLFGDALPREPLLAPFRNHSMYALAFEDLDGDGKKGADEPALEGVKICVDHDTCGTTGPNGAFVADGLGDGRHRIRADASRVEGAIATTEAEQTAAVGSYSRPTVQFGFRRGGEIVVRAFIDLNANGVRDAGEYDLDQGGARIVGPGVDVEVPLGRKGRAAFYEKGAFTVSLDVMALPTGYAGPRAGVTVQADRFAPMVVEVPVRPVRSIAGRVCVDRNGNGVCDPGELLVGFARVSDGGPQAVTDEQGNFLLRDLGPGTHAIRVAEADWPAGSFQRRAPTAELGLAPSVVRGISVPLAFAPLARSDKTVEMEWPGAGKRPARLSGGYYFKPNPEAASRFVPAGDDAAVLAKLLRRAREGESRFSVIVYADVRRYRAAPEKALAEARAAAGGIARWLQRRLPDAPVVAEARSPADHEQVAEVRVYLAVTPSAGDSPRRSRPSRRNKTLQIPDVELEAPAKKP